MKSKGHEEGVTHFRRDCKRRLVSVNKTGHTTKGNGQPTTCVPQVSWDHIEHQTSGHRRYDTGEFLIRGKYLILEVSTSRVLKSLFFAFKGGRHKNLYNHYLGMMR